MKEHTFIELDHSALAFNISQIKKAAHHSDIALVVKSNAYGHGIGEIARMADEIPSINWLCTASLSEAVMLKHQGIKKPILVLSYLDDDLQQAALNDIHVTLYNLEDAYALSAAAAQVHKKFFVHIKIDSGMSRLGILPEDALAFVQAVQRIPHLVIHGLSTHLCDTPNPDQNFSLMQLKKFDAVIELLEAAGIYIPCIHAQSSSSLCVKPYRSYSLIRSGAAAYGIWKSQDHRKLILKEHPDFDLKPVLTWKTHIIHLKKVPAGTTVGYDRTFTTQRPTILAIAPIGYSDGYARGLSNRGTALIKNQFVPVAGIVSMNLTAFDVTDVPDVRLYEDITLMGDNSFITASECAQAAHIITNEMVAHINPLIKKIIVHQPVVTTYKDPTTAHSHASLLTEQSSS